MLVLRAIEKRNKKAVSVPQGAIPGARRCCGEYAPRGGAVFFSGKRKKVVLGY